MLNVFQRIIQIFKNGEFKNVGVLVGSTATSQMLLVLISPILTRLYSPNDLGLFSLITAITNTMGLLVALRYELAIFAAESDLEAKRIVLISIFLAISITFISCCILYVLTLSEIIHSAILPVWCIIFIFFSTVFYVITFIFRNYFAKSKKFTIIGKTNLWQSIGRSVLQVAFFPFGALGILLGDTLGRAFGLLQSVREIQLTNLFLNERKNIPILISVFKKFQSFPKFVLPSSLLDILSTTIQLPIIIGLYGLESGGVFGLSQRVVTAPLLLLGAGFADVFHANIAEKVQNQSSDIMKSFLNTVKILFLFALPVFTVLFFFGEDIFGFFFGKKWLLAGKIAEVTSIWMFFQFLVSPVSRIILLSDKKYYKFIYDVFSITSTILVPYITHKNGANIIEAMYWLGIFRSISYVIYFFVIYYLVFDLNRNGQKMKDLLT